MDRIKGVLRCVIEKSFITYPEENQDKIIHRRFLSCLLIALDSRLLHDIHEDHDCGEVYDKILVHK